MSTSINTGYIPNNFYNPNGTLIDATDARTVAQSASTVAAQLPPAEASIFQSLVQNSIEFTPGAELTQGEIDKNLDRLKTLASDIFDFLQLGSLSTDLIKCLIQATYNEQKQAIQEANLQAQAQMSQALDAATQDSNGADELKRAALTGVVLGVFAGALTMIGGIVGGLSAMKTLSSLGKLEDEMLGAGTKALTTGLNETPQSTIAPGQQGGAGVPQDGAIDDSLPQQHQTTLQSDGANDLTQPQTGPSDPTNNNPISDGKAALDQVNTHNLKLNKIDARGKKWAAFEKLVEGAGQLFQQNSVYQNTMGQANNQSDQAAGQTDAAKSAASQQLYNTLMGILQNILTFVEAVMQALSSISQSQTGMSQAIAGAKATA